MKVDLHPRQKLVFDDPAQYKVVAAGRRFGKSYLAAVTLFVEAAKNFKTLKSGREIDLALEEVYYVAPTFEQGRRIMWPLLKDMGRDLIKQAHENTCEVTLVNGRRISIKGADRPDSLRGVGLSHVVLDEYAFMKEDVWEMILEPALARAQGTALFIGTPEGKNHFYSLYLRGDAGLDADYKSWHFKSEENPYLSKEWLDKRRAGLTADKFAREYEASFDAKTGIVFTEAMFPIVDEEPHPGDYYICCDLAGYEKVDSGKRLERKSNHAIAVVKVHKGGWYVKEVIWGMWDVRETALRIVQAWHKYRPVKLGIEKGMAHTAVLPYLEDQQERLGIFFPVDELSHGNQKKADRIEWALQGLADKGRITLAPGEWNAKFLQEAMDFPSTIAQNDLLDAVSYTNQIALPFYGEEEFSVDTWNPLDKVVGV
jgi:hypothetical protein